MRRLQSAGKTVSSRVMQSTSKTGCDHAGDSDQSINRRIYARHCGGEAVPRGDDNYDDDDEVEVEEERKKERKMEKKARNGTGKNE